MIDKIKKRLDDYSVQYFQSASDCFFVRHELTQPRRRRIEFSDFAFRSEHFDQGLKVLTETWILYQETDTKGFRFLDIYPQYAETRDRNELIKRHDALVLLSHAFCSSQGMELSNAILDERLGKFDTKVDLTTASKPLDTESSNA